LNDEINTEIINVGYAKFNNAYSKCKNKEQYMEISLKSNHICTLLSKQ